MVRLVGLGAAVLGVGLVALAGLWTRLGEGAVVPLGLAALDALAMMGLAQWTLGGVRRGAFRTVTPHPADFVTMARSVLGSVCLAVVVAALVGDVALPSWWLAAPAIPALLLDAVDGPVARRTRTASAAGGRYDMEVDVVFALTLALGASLVYGWWVMALGCMRYAWVLASVFLPRLRRALAFRQSRRVIAAAQGVVLVGSVTPLLPYQVNVVALVTVAAALLFSFGRDAVTLLRAPASGGTPG